jgi:hypothetical protein
MANLEPTFYTVCAGRLPEIRQIGSGVLAGMKEAAETAAQWLKRMWGGKG